MVHTVLQLAATAQPLRRGNEYYWTCVRALTESVETFTIPDIARLCDQDVRRSVKRFVGRLVEHNYAIDITPEKTPARATRTYRLLRRPIETPVFRCDDGRPSKGFVQAQIWGTIRYQLRHGFTLSELALYASTDEVTVQEKTAHYYVQHLVRAGIVSLVERGRPHHPARYRLRPSQDLGPAAPRIVRAEFVYDPNLKRIVGEAEGREVAS